MVTLRFTTIFSVSLLYIAQLITINDPVIILVNAGSWLIKGVFLDSIGTNVISSVCNSAIE